MLAFLSRGFRSVLLEFGFFGEVRGRGGTTGRTGEVDGDGDAEEVEDETWDWG